MAPGHNFQAFSIKFSGRSHRIITPVMVCAGFDPLAPPDPPPPQESTTALWDTGATNSVISTAMVKALNLVPVGKVNVNHAGGVGASLTYAINLGLPNHVAVAGIVATEFPDTHGFGAIVGMDVICLGDLSITNVADETMMSFRIPSCEAIDYVKDANRLKFAGASRNAPCPCGTIDPATKRVPKFKHCHGR